MTQHPIYHCTQCITDFGLQPHPKGIKVFAKCDGCQQVRQCNVGKKKIVDFRKFFDTAQPKKEIPMQLTPHTQKTKTLKCKTATYIISLDTHPNALWSGYWVLKRVTDTIPYPRAELVSKSIDQIIRYLSEAEQTTQAEIRRIYETATTMD